MYTNSSAYYILIIINHVYNNLTTVCMSGGIPIVGNYPTSSHEYYQSGHLWNDKMIKKQYQVYYNIIFNI